MPGQDRHRVPSHGVLPGQGHAAHPAPRPPPTPHPLPAPPQLPWPNLAPQRPYLGRDQTPAPRAPRATSTSRCCHSHRAREVRGKRRAGPTPWPVPFPALRCRPRPGGGAFLPIHPPASSGCRALGTSAAFLRLPPLCWAPAKAAALPGARGAERPWGHRVTLGTLPEEERIGTWGLLCPPQPREGAPVTHGSTQRPHPLRGVPLPGIAGTGDASLRAMACLAWLGTARHCMAQHGTVHHRTAWHSPAQLSVA